MNDVLKIAIESIPETNPNILVVLSGLLTPLLALIATYIAYQQHKINRNRLKNELYERRMEVYKKFNLFISEFLREGHTTFEQTHIFYNSITQSKFLFGNDVQIYLNNIKDKLLENYKLRLKLYPKNNTPGLPVGEERSKVCDEQHKIILWIDLEVQKSVDVFKNYFTFK